MRPSVRLVLQGSQWRKTRISSPFNPRQRWPDAWEEGSPTGTMAASADDGEVFDVKYWCARAGAMTSRAALSFTYAPRAHVHARVEFCYELRAAACRTTDAQLHNLFARALAPLTPLLAALSGCDPPYAARYDVQRLHFHAKLGNLVLLPATGASGGAAGADFDAKAMLWRGAGAAARAPRFTGPLLAPGARYARFRFCYDECRQRHAGRPLGSGSSQGRRGHARPWLVLRGAGLPGSRGARLP